MENSKGQINYSQPGSLTEIADLPSAITIDKYESGRAEALGTLCRIMCSKKTGEEILPVYLARFYLAVQQGLKIPSNRECGECMVAILMNSSDLFRVDLDGVRILLPSFISALEIVLPDRDLKLKTHILKSDLRRASINLLLSMLVLPLHFQNIVIKELHSSKFYVSNLVSALITLYFAGGSDRSVTFAELKPRLMNLVMSALQAESDPQNTHMLLGGLFLCVQDSAIYEKVEQVMQPSVDTASNLLTSGKFIYVNFLFATSIAQFHFLKCSILKYFFLMLQPFILWLM